MPPTPPRLPPMVCDCSPKFIVPALEEAYDCADPADSEDWILPRLVVGVEASVAPALTEPLLPAQSKGGG